MIRFCFCRYILDKIYHRLSVYKSHLDISSSSRCIFIHSWRRVILKERVVDCCIWHIFTMKDSIAARQLGDIFKVIRNLITGKKKRNGEERRNKKKMFLIIVFVINRRYCYMKIIHYYPYILGIITRLFFSFLLFSSLLIIIIIITFFVYVKFF